MKADIKKQWLAALRSGAYKQGIGKLESVTADGSKFCCMGVLCDLGLRDGGANVERKVATDNRGCPDAVSYDGEFGTLPGSILNWADLSSNVPWVTYRWVDGRATPMDLIKLNDTLGLSFIEIADLIEAHL